MRNSTIANLEYFGYREIEIAIKLMRAYIYGDIPNWFSRKGVTVEFNPNSGYVFLTNDEAQVLMHEEKLTPWFSLSQGGNEGTANDLYFDFICGNIVTKDYEELFEILLREKMYEKAENVRKELVKHNES